MATKYGLFMEHQYLGPQKKDKPELTEEEKEKGLPATREQGLNFKATVGRRGKNNDATFDKFARLSEGIKYVDPLKAKLQDDAERKKKNLTDNAFKTISPMKASTTPGDFQGTFGKIPYIPSPLPERKKKGEVPEQPKGIFTSPAKKGTFGFNKTTLSERQGVKGVCTEYEYLHDPEEEQIRRRREALEADHKARVTDLPFKPSNPPKKGGFGVPNTTISKGKGVAGEWEYVIPPPEEKKETDDKEIVPFKPSYAFASKRVEHIPYLHDPEEPKLKAASEARLTESKRLATTGPWRPSHGAPKVDMTRSIVKMNLR